MAETDRFQLSMVLSDDNTARLEYCGVVVEIPVNQIMDERRWQRASMRMNSLFESRQLARGVKEKDPWEYKSITWTGILRRRVRKEKPRSESNYRGLPAADWDARAKQWRGGMSLVSCEQSEWTKWASNTRSNLSRRKSRGNRNSKGVKRLDCEAGVSMCVDGTTADS
jgi:hypothetical protein